MKAKVIRFGEEGGIKYIIIQLLEDPSVEIRIGDSVVIKGVKKRGK